MHGEVPPAPLARTDRASRETQGPGPHSHVVQQSPRGGGPLGVPLDGVHLVLQHTWPRGSRPPPRAQPSSPPATPAGLGRAPLTREGGTA